MKILVTGATGFIACQLVTDLLRLGHSVTCCVQSVALAARLFPNATIIKANFLTDTTRECWLERVRGIDIVINAVGIFYHPSKKYV